MVKNVFSGWGDGVPGFGELAGEITAGRAGAATGVFAQLGQMFSKSMPEGVDSKLLSSTMDQWQSFWMLPAIIAGVIAVIFFVAFWDKIQVTEEDGDEDGSESEAAAIEESNS